MMIIHIYNDDDHKDDEDIDDGEDINDDGDTDHNDMKCIFT